MEEMEAGDYNYRGSKTAYKSRLSRLWQAVTVLRAEYLEFNQDFPRDTTSRLYNILCMAIIEETFQICSHFLFNWVFTFFVKLKVNENEKNKKKITN